MLSASSFLANGAHHPFVSLSSSTKKKKNKPSSSFRSLSSSSSTKRKNAPSHLLFARKSASSFRKVRVNEPPSRHKRTSSFFFVASALSRGVLSGEIASSATNHLKINSQKQLFVPLTTKNRREVNTHKIERLRMTRL